MCAPRSQRESQSSTANKGPIAHAYRELRALAAEQGVALRFESTVMDGTPIFNMAAAALPATTIAGFRWPAQQHQQLCAEPDGAGRDAGRGGAAARNGWASPRPTRRTTWRAGTPRSRRPCWRMCCWAPICGPATCGARGWARRRCARRRRHCCQARHSSRWPRLSAWATP